MDVSRQIATEMESAENFDALRSSFFIAFSNSHARSF